MSQIQNNEMNQQDLEETQIISEVVLESLVVLKILKHCKENLFEAAAGQLLGLEVENKLEVTNSFPFPNKLSTEETEEDAEDTSAAEYQVEMMRCLREVNVDHNTVGWYFSTYMNSFHSATTIDTQFNYQDRIPNAVMIACDPLKTITQGALGLKAYRLTSSFMELYRSVSFTKESLLKSKVNYKEIFEEIPLKVHSSNLISAFLLEFQESHTLETDFERFDLSTASFLEKNLESLGESLDELAAEQNKFQYYQRNLQKQQTQRAAWLQKRRAENAARKLSGEPLLPEEDPTNPIFKPIPEPARLDSLILTSQINAYCKEINEFSANSFTKLFLTAQLNNHQPTQQ